LYTRAGVFVFISNANLQRAIAGRKSNKDRFYHAKTVDFGLKALTGKGFNIFFK